MFRLFIPSLELRLPQIRFDKLSVSDDPLPPALGEGLYLGGDPYQTFHVEAWGSADQEASTFAFQIFLLKNVIIFMLFLLQLFLFTFFI